MLGLAYLGAMALYFSGTYFFVRWAWRRGFVGGGSRLKGLMFGALGFLLAYHLVFWNWVPVIIEHRAMCGTDAGFFMNVPASEWVMANRPEIKRRGSIDPEKFTSSILTQEGYWRSIFMDGLLATDTRSSKAVHWGVPLWHHRMRVIDISTGKVLSEAVDYSVSSREDVRLWLPQESCFRAEETPVRKFSQYKQELKEVVK